MAKSERPDFRTRVERLFRIIEMIGVLALLLAALPPWGALIVIPLTFLLTAYILETAREEIIWKVRESAAPPKSLGRSGAFVLTLAAFLALAVTFTSIVYLAARVRDVLTGG